MSMATDFPRDASRLAVCAYFVPEITAALALESLAVELVPFHGRCDERPLGCHCLRPADSGAPLLCGGCAGDSTDSILSFEWCFELLLGPTDLSSLLSQGCHLLTPCMLDTWTENVEAWGFSPKAAREYFGESVSRFVVLDAGVQPVSPDVLSEITRYTGRPVEVLSISLDYLRLMLRHALGLVARQSERKELQAKLTLSQGLNSDLGMAYDLLARMQPFPDEAAAVAGLLELFVALFAPRAVHYLPVAGGHGTRQSLPAGAVLGNGLAARSWAKEGDYGLLGGGGFHILVHKDQEVLGRVLVEGLAFPERREDYLSLATFVTPVLALFILNGRIHESLLTAEAVRREKNVLRAVLDAVPVWIAYLDRDGRIVVDNQQQATLFGLPVPQEKNEASWKALAPLLLEEHHALLARCLEGETVPFARELTEIPGSKPFVSGTYVPVRQEDGQVVGAIVAISDISEPMRKERERRDQETIYQVIFNGSRDGILIADTANRHFHHANPAICELLGYRPEELMQMGMADIHPLAEMPDVRAAFERSLRGEEQESVELSVRRKDGSVFPAEISSTPIHLGDQSYMVKIFRDISTRREAERRLRLNAAVFNNALEGITIADSNGIILDVNDGFTYITGFTREEAVGGNSSMHQSGLHDAAFYSSIWQEIKTQGHWGGEIWNRRKNGELYAEWLNITTVRDDNGEVANYIGVFSDITFVKQHEKQLERTAHYDALTGIPNRLLLADRMKQAIVQAKREQKMLSVCYLDLDGFKPVNDTLGHQAGDRVLVEIAGRIGSILREGDTIARLGGDEFVVLLPNLNHVEECIDTVKRLHDAIAQPIFIQDQLVSLTASIGVSVFPDDDNDSDVLLRHADQAMYIAKQSGKNRYHLFDPAHDQQSRAYQNAMLRIQQGLDNQEFELYYQPKVDLATLQVIGAEALIRWNHPERGLLLPGEFLNDIRNSELEIRLGEWVIDTALSQLMQWCEEGLTMDISVNIAACHLQHEGFVEYLKYRFSEHPNLPAGRLHIEILETAALEDFTEAAQTMEACRVMGARFALDDFGTGYSSLTYLHRLAVDTLKIDQSFVHDMLVDKGDNAIVQGVIALAKAFNLKTVAEGIETMEHFDALLAMGCESGQGYGIARPMPASDFSGWARNYCVSS